VVQHASRPGQFVVLSAWKDPKAFDAHREGLRTREFLDRIHALRVSPADNRLHGALSVAAVEDGALAKAGPGAVCVVTHVDVIPPRKDDAVALLKALGDAGRKDEGNLRYEVVQQTNRPNHFSVVEVWKSREAFDAHSMSGYIREFRDKLAPMSGALYDERLYGVLN
jgi:quinol monooxygenase YgiN